MLVCNKNTTDFTTHHNEPIEYIDIKISILSCVQAGDNVGNGRYAGADKYG